MNDRENRLRAIRFEGPERIPMSFGFNAACYHHYDHEVLKDLMEEHPLLFPNFERTPEPFDPGVAPWQRADEPYRDPWGCLWVTSDDGITGHVVENALADWKDFDGYLPPDPARTKGKAPEGSIDWEEETARIERRKRNGQFVGGGLPHGHTYLRLLDLRGYENLTFDMADEEPLLRELIGMVESFNLHTVRRYVEMGVDQMSYAEDLGMQQGPMLSPPHFRRYIKPAYRRMVRPAHEAGCILHMHSDGDIRELTGDLIDLGLDVLNLQDLVNGIDWIRDKLKGRVCIDLDIDRQKIVRFGTPQEIDDLIREEVEKLASPEGGLMMTCGIYPGIPVENLRALMDAMEEYSDAF
jgi:hypothetical protein